jgi:hypothetical protein
VRALDRARLRAEGYASGEAVRDVALDAVTGGTSRNRRNVLAPSNRRSTIRHIASEIL